MNTTAQKTRGRMPTVLLGALIGAVALFAAAPASALAAPVLELSSSHKPATDPVPAGSHAVYEIAVKNTGDAETSGPTTVDFTVPPGLEITGVTDESAPTLASFELPPLWDCSVAVDGLSAGCTGVDAAGHLGGPFSIPAGGEACDGLGVGTCHLLVTVRADGNATPGLAHPTVTACGDGVTVCPTVAATAPDDPLQIVPGGFSLTSLTGDVLDEFGDPATQAGSRPNTAFADFSVITGLEPNGVKQPIEDVRSVTVKLPPGVVGNPQAVGTCTQAQAYNRTCPVTSQIGEIAITFSSSNLTEKYPLYNMETAPGLPALIAFNAFNTLIQNYPSVRTGDDYGITVLQKDIPQSIPFHRVKTTVWGVPADSSHDPERLCEGGIAGTGPYGCPSPDAGDPKPFFTLPTSCTGPLETFVDLTSWFGASDGSSFVTAPGGTGCPAVPFAPTIAARPTTNVGDAPSGLDVDLTVPQNEDPNGVAAAHLKDTTVTLPEGLTVNPSGANGLGACSESDFGYTSTDPDGTIHTTPDAATCPDAARVATAEVESPLVDHPMIGSAYIAAPHANPFDSLLALYITIDDAQTGVVVKLAGEVKIDPGTGQLTTIFEDNPQLPFDHFKLHFKGGSHGTLRTPAICGVHTTNATLTPWSATGGAAPVDLSDPWSIDQNCSNAAGEEPNTPDLDAGAVSPIAASYSPTVVTLRREDGSQEFSTVNLTLPPGMTGKLAGIPACSDAALTTAASKPGREEEASPSCPAASRIGTVNVAAGAGPAPYNAQGSAYLTGPYKGAPLGLAIVTPATAGPFDLGTVVVRTALHLDPNTGQITAVSDPIPSILQGIPLDIRSAQIKLDKPNFTRNGTSCDPSAFNGSLLSTLGQSAPLTERFQLGECTGLAFKPKLGIRLSGGTKRGGHPALKGIVTMPEGGANIAKAVVALPHSEFLDQGHIGTVCTRVQFAEGDGNGTSCPAASVYGQAVGTSPLVDYPLEGPAILRSSSNKLPDLVIALHGPASQPVAVDVVGRIDSVKGGIRTSFEGVPDLPVSSFVLSMQGGKKGLLQNSTNICKGVHKATAEFDAQNGKTADLTPVLKAKCPKAAHHKRPRRTARRQRAVR